MQGEIVVTPPPAVGAALADKPTAAPLSASAAQRATQAAAALALLAALI